jgi:hypothetical protein
MFELYGDVLRHIQRHGFGERMTYLLIRVALG